MNPNALVREIVAEFRKLEQAKDRPEWTKKVLTTLCKLGRWLGYTAWAKGDPKEWLYDVSWSNCDTCGRLISVPMVAECEWGTLEDIAYDFEKLLLARAAVRVMVYDAWSARNSDEPVEFINKKLREYVRTFNGACGDTYLLIALVWDDSSDTNRFEFAEIVDQGPGNSPILQTL